ncbi:MAG: glycosyltransferase family 39 protein [Verrucomicrobia bacterium]|nr:glycosyltransferase family 39 protein [Verrucomicrobiota bacterium]
MTWLETCDVALFRFVNQTLSHPLLDCVLPLFSSPPCLAPLLLMLALGVLWKGGVRGRVLVAVLVLILALGDGLIVQLLKDALGRPRPFQALPDVRLPAGRAGGGSMPSSHAAMWFAAALVARVFHPRSVRFMLPLAALVGLSRVYLGAHYPGDVVAGAVLGAGWAAAGLWLFDALWRWAGPRWFPAWWAAFPSLLDPRVRPGVLVADAADRERHWVRAGYVLIGLMLLARLAYIASGTIEVSKDEAYQWLWSKHLALSYYSKPPMIAWLHGLGTTLAGDNAFGIRFLSPILGAILGIALLRFMTRHVNAAAAFALLLILNTTPLMALGTVLMTVDPPLVLFWSLAMIAGWRALRPDAASRHWVLVGLAMGLGFLSKYTAALQLVCWILLFALWPPARAHLRRRGPYLALLVFAVCALPVVVWNVEHGWITVEHLAANADLHKPWKATPRFLGEFLGVETALLNPVFFLGALWAMGACWSRRRTDPLQRYLCCMGAPVFAGYALYALHSRIQPNWIAAAVLPMFCLMVAHWQRRWREGAWWVKEAFAAGLLLGLLAVVLMHETRLVGRIVGRNLPPEMDPLRRVRAWRETAVVVDAARRRLEADGKPAFVIADHYGMTALLTLYLPAAKAALNTEPLVYARSALHPENQFHFWPGYRGRRTGQNAVYVAELSPDALEPGWIRSWLQGLPIARAARQRAVPGISALVAGEFASVRDLGVHEVPWRGSILRRVRLYECRHLQ